jgi:hypothetical protein
VIHLSEDFIRKADLLPAAVDPVPRWGGFIYFGTYTVSNAIECTRTPLIDIDGRHQVDASTATALAAHLREVRGQAERQVADAEADDHLVQDGAELAPRPKHRWNLLQTLRPKPPDIRSLAAHEKATREELADAFEMVAFRGGEGLREGFVDWPNLRMPWE